MLFVKHVMDDAPIGSGSDDPLVVLDKILTLVRYQDSSIHEITGTWCFCDQQGECICSRWVRAAKGLPSIPARWNLRDRERFKANMLAN